MSNFWNDIRYALRGLRQAPLFTAIAVLSLALGVGANTAIFTLLDQVMLRLLPVKQPGQLVLLTMVGSHYGSNWGNNSISYPMYKDFLDNNQAFSGMFCRFATSASMGVGNHAERVRGELVSGTYFPVLGVTASLGRIVTSADDKLPGGHPVVVLSNAFWRARFASDPAIVGRQITLNSHAYTVIGVAQPGFDGVELGSTATFFVPIMMKAQMTPFWDGLKDRRQRWVNAFGRLKPGMSIKTSKASLQPFMHSMLAMEVQQAAFRNASPFTRQEFLKCYIDVLPGGQGRSYVREHLSTPLWLLFAITGAVLLMACANLANLLLARATTRQREVAIRLAVGAGRMRIIRQLLVESLLLSIFGALFGLGFAFAGDQALMSIYMSSDTDLKLSAIPDLRILLFTAAVALLTTILFGLVPAIQACRPAVASTLKNEAGSVVGGSGNVLLRKSLVTIQIALSLLLLIAAGLFLRTLDNLRDLGPGFSPQHLVAFNLDPGLSGYDTPKTKIFFQRLSDEIKAVPGVQTVGLANVRILEENEWDSSMTAEGFTPAPGQGPEPYMNSISPGYFATLGVPVIAGRDFTQKDTQQIKHGPEPDDWSPSTVIINRSFAKKYFYNRNPIGLHLGFGSDPGTKTDMQIVGMVDDMRYTNLRDEIPVQAYVPYLAGRNVNDMTVYFRTSIDPAQLMPIVRQKVASLDRNIPIYSMRTTEQQISNSLRAERLIASLSVFFGLLATFLAVIGLYGVMAYTVSRRTREIGIRMALGAVEGNVIWLVMREVLTLLLIGVVVGLPLAIALSRVIQSQLYGLEPHDPLTLSSAVVLLAVVACLAGLIPALRASRINPIRALRYE